MPIPVRGWERKQALLTRIEPMSQKTVPYYSYLDQVDATDMETVAAETSYALDISDFNRLRGA